MDINDIGAKHKFHEELERFNKFQKMFIESSDKAKKLKPLNMEIKDYAKYLLKEGSVIEKRELLACVKTKLVLTQKILTLEKK